MINTIEIKNFQSLKDAELELGQFTCLIGQSNAGKSAVIRAIKALANNARGKDMVRHGTSEAKVSVVLDDGTEVSWFKGARSRFEIDGAVYDKIGLDVPDIIKDKLKFGTHTVAGADVDFNVQGQLQGPFFVSQTSPARSKIIGTITRYDMIQTAVSDAQRQKKTAMAEAATARKQLDVLEPQIEALQELRELEPVLVKFTQREEELRGIETRLSTLKSLRMALIASQSNLEQAQQKYDQLDRLSDIEVLFGEVTEYREGLDVMKNELDRLKDLRRTLVDADRNIYAHEKTVQSLHATIRSVEQQIVDLPPEQQEQRCPTCGQLIEVTV